MCPGCGGYEINLIYSCQYYCASAPYCELGLGGYLLVALFIWLTIRWIHGRGKEYERNNKVVRRNYRR